MRFVHFLACLLSLSMLSTPGRAGERPLLQDFVGLNGHFKFKPELYQPVCRLVRNYHNINWDVAAPGDPITFPVCVNKVNWESLYASWTEHDFEINACLQFGKFGSGAKDYQSLWEGQLDWAEDYGYAVAKGLSERDLATSIEIGNEPGSGFDDRLFREIFKRMASGVRRADPEMQILTCTVHTRAADKYHKQLDATFGTSEMQALFDVISVHVYSEKAEADQAHPWERSYPEDPSIDYLARVDEVIEWRDQNTPEKEIWITEFGYDACSEAAMAKREGWFKKLAWTGQTELQQAQWLVRSLLCFASRDIDRAYIYYYDDSDKASVHAASGLTRNYEPKPAYWAVQQFYELLGDYRFNRALREEVGELYAYEFSNNANELIWVLWSPTGEARRDSVQLQQLPSEPKRIVGMRTDEASAEEPTFRREGRGLTITVGESPVFIIF